MGIFRVLESYEVIIIVIKNRSMRYYYARLEKYTSIKIIFVLKGTNNLEICS